MEAAKPSKSTDKAAALAAIQQAFPKVTDFERDFPSLCFALATGVGKTRLMGAFISYLRLAYGLQKIARPRGYCGGSRNVAHLYRHKHRQHAGVVPGGNELVMPGRPFRATTVVVMLSIATTASADSLEAILQPKTTEGFTRYAAAVESRMERELRENAPFLDIERQPPAQLEKTMAALRRGEVVVSRAVARDGSASEIEVTGGMINHWRGTAYIPKVTLDVLLKTLQEPQSDKHKQEDVISSRVVATGENSQKLYLRLRRTKLITVVYDTEYDTTYRRVAADRGLSNSISTRIVEIENAGTPQERARPEGNDHGFMWRLYSYWRYKQVGDGVIVEVESVTLSRKLPFLIGPLLRPVVNSTARDSITRTLTSMRVRFAN